MFRKTTKCGKKKGEYCRLHSPQPENTSDKEKFMREALRAYNMRELAKKKHPCKTEAELLSEVEASKRKERELEAQKAQAFLVNDMENHMNLKIDPKTGQKTVSVYRAGVVEAPVERGVEKESYIACDNYVPENRQGRNTGIFASPTVNGVSHWVRGVSNVVKDWGVRELRVNPDEVYVYSVRAWEKFSGDFNGFTEENANKYWNSGMTLTQWHEEMRTNPNMKPEEWELLLGPEHIQTSKNVKADLVARQAYYSNNGEKDSEVYDLLTRQLGRRS
jgi:hypothetical protein